MHIYIKVWNNLMLKNHTFSQNESVIKQPSNTTLVNPTGLNSYTFLHITNY